MTEPVTTTMPVLNAHISAALDQDGKIIGVQVRCLFLHDQITLLPDMMIDSAHRVLDRAVQDAK